MFVRIPALPLVALTLLAALVPECVGQQASSGKQTSKPNVLFIAVDDLRPELRCYGHPLVKSPNMDGLAKRGLLFNRAYCQQAVCSPSRTSLLTGRRPDSTKIYNLEDHFRDTIPDVVTLPQHFKRNGYFCQAFGKIYHGGLDDPDSWSAPSVYGEFDPEYQPGSAFAAGQFLSDDRYPDAPLKFAAAGPRSKPKRRSGPKGLPWEAKDAADNELRDGMIADQAIKVLRDVKDRPFFLAVGFVKPHLPFVAPKKYFDLYKLEDIRLPTNPQPPKDVFEIALSNWGELRTYKGMPKEGPVTDQQARELIRGYYAATSYTDAQIGRVLAELDRLGLRDNTIIVLWGDHGWQLGEHGMWCKHTNYEVATRAAMMIAAPGQKKTGAKTDALVEFVDIYPTLCELAGLPLPGGLEGTSFVPLLRDPKQPWKRAAFSQYPRGKLMGYALRTDRYRYVEWMDEEKNVAGAELYDHKNDPQENVNVANQPENKKLVEQLSRQVRAGWRAALPPN